MIDTPHYHIVESTLRYVAWRNNTFGLHVHVGIRGADRAIAVNSALRTVLPELLALSGSSPWLEDRHTHLHSTRTEIFTSSSRAAASPTASTAGPSTTDFVALPDRHALDPRAHRDLVERAPPPGLPDGRDPDLRRPARLRPLASPCPA